MPQPLKRQTFPVSTLVGSILMILGVVPAVLWILDYIDVIRPGEQPGEWAILLASAGFLGLGTMLVRGDGDSIADAFMSWFKKQ